MAVERYAEHPARRTEAAFDRPDWVILGTVHGEGGVVVYASNELSQASLELIIEEEPERWFGDVCVQYNDRVRHIVMTATGKTYVMTYGATYGEAIATLFTFWKPERAETKELGRGRS